MSTAEWDGWDTLPATAEERDQAADRVLEDARGRALTLIVDGKRGQALYQLTRALLEAGEILELPVAEAAS